MTATRKTLTEDFQSQLQIVENKGGRFIARGEFGRCDVPTKNGRIYPRKIMEREIEKLRPSFKVGGVAGHLDHPTSGSGLTNASHVITNLHINDDGVVIGEALVLGNDRGKTIRELIELGYKVGVSSRGRGSTMPSSTQEGEEVQEDFDLVTWDFVENPAVTTALPKFYTEDVDEEPEAESMAVADMFMREFPSLVESIRGESAVDSSGTLTEGKDEDADSSELFERKLRDALVGIKEDVKREVMEEAESDPDIAGAKGVLAAVAEMVSAYMSEPDEDTVRDAIKASELAVSESEYKIEKLEKELLEARCSTEIESKISGHPMSKTIRKLIEDKTFESVDAATEMVETILSDLPDDIVTNEEVGIREENVELKGKITLLETRVDDLSGRLQKAAKLGERIDEQRIEELGEVNDKLAELESLLERTKAKHDKAMGDKELEILEVKKSRSELDAYKLEKVAGLVNGRKVFGLLESVTDKAEVDKLVEEEGSVGVGDPMLESMRKSVSGKGKTGTKARLEEEVADNKSSNQSMYPDVMDMGSMMSLAGYEDTDN